MAYADERLPMSQTRSSGAERPMLSLDALRRYFAVVIPAHLAWEFGHMPLYTIWHEGTAGEILFAGLHCTGGDILIALSTLVGALLLFGREWPADRLAARWVAIVTVLAGIGYTIFSEWLNVEVREAWDYTARMPTLPLVGTGLSPVLQWLIIPLLGFWWAAKPFRKEA
ncbi:hypothetical protein [Tranquillimonas rosea]